ncbi:DNA (cytosine-5-)-methyltransferase [Flavobacteriaceae bacterium R38]|nr:DNA (cytosine-5-)-methyltransferase [Flavobacteriaceae bacterium R38]
MPKLNNIPIIDLFAGPGGLGEGFSSIYNKNKKVFDIKLSIEKDENAHETLELRSFFRQFNKDKKPNEYYKLLEEPNLKKRTELKQELFEKYPNEYRVAEKEAWKAELGSKKFPSEKIDKRIKKGLGKATDWVLIGGPPCQAYSLVGRSRVGGIDEQDHRVYLYQEYLRIIAKHHPSVFVMENVKGLLSAKLEDEKIFPKILEDLRNPGIIFPDLNSPEYTIYSLVKDEIKNDKDYLIKSENYGIPQKRHRVILLGIREDVNVIPNILKAKESLVKLKDVIGDLPKIRSGLNRSFLSSELVEGKKKRYYENEIDTDENWEDIINDFRKEIISWNGFAKDYSNNNINAPAKGIGSEFVKCKTPYIKNPLFDWYNDPALKGVPNHESRSHLVQDLKRYMFSSMYTKTYKRFPRLPEYNQHSDELLPDHENAQSGKFADRFRVQLSDQPATTITSHISKDGHYFIHYDADQCRSLTVREAARIQTFPDNYLFCGSRTAQYHQVGNAVPPYLAKQIAEIVFDLFKKINNNG